jgi:hypothetical protein
LTKNQPEKCTDAHVSIIGHIVRDELRRELVGTEMGNGFANRFLFVCARRSKLLPDGGGDLDVTGLAFRLAGAMREARAIGKGPPLERDDQARVLWHEVYERLSDGKPGLLGAVTSRAEAQAMRIAVIYAALDGRHAIGIEHLRAALEVWRYCEESARYIFGDATGDPVADEILAALRNAEAVGMSRAEIYDMFGRHRSRDRIGGALASLAATGVASMSKESTGGRPVERWRAS